MDTFTSVATWLQATGPYGLVAVLGWAFWRVNEKKDAQLRGATMLLRVRLDGPWRVLGVGTPGCFLARFRLRLLCPACRHPWGSSRCSAYGR